MKYPTPRPPASRHLALTLCLTAVACGDASMLDEDHTAHPETARVDIPIVDPTNAGRLTGAMPQANTQGPVAATVPAGPPPPGMDAGTTSAPVVSQPAAQATASAQPATGQSNSTSASGPFGSAAQRATVRTYIQRLMDETRIVPATSGNPGGPRGSAGSFAKLSSDQVEEFVSAIIYGAGLFLPKSLSDEERWALVAAEISIESAFTPGTSGANPGDNSKVSVGPLQLTLPGMWDDTFRQYAQIPGLVHHDGSAWDIKSTNNDALKTSIFDGIIAALWCITEQGRRGCPDWFGGPDGPCPKNMHTAFLAWVIGGPALKEGRDLNGINGLGQRDAYLASIGTDLTLLGFSPSLIESAF